MIEVLKQALEALEKSNRFVWHYAHSKATARIAEQCDEAITSLRKAIQEEALRNVQRIGQEIEQEPYGWVSQHTTKGMYEWQFNKRESSVYIDTAISIVPVYTHPPQRNVSEQLGEPVGWFVDFGDGDDASYCVVGGQEPKEPRAIVRPLFFHPLQRTEPPAWFPAVENILNEYGLQAIDFVADFKAAMKDAEQPQRTWERPWVSLTDEDKDTADLVEAEVEQSWIDGYLAGLKDAEAKLKQKNGFAEEKNT